MKPFDNGTLPAVVSTALKSRSESGSGADTPLSAAVATYDDLARILVPLIGDVGLKALSARALHLAQRAFPAPPTPDQPPPSFETWLAQLDPSEVTAAATLMLSALGSLLGTFIGESLTIRLLRKAWPEGFPDVHAEETDP